MEAYCDLHMHSTASDGTDAPDALASIAVRERVCAIALTDHDTTAGLQSAATACAAAGIAFVPGIELSCDPRGVNGWSASPGRRLGTLHILGLFVRHDDPMLAAIHDRLLIARSERNPMIVEKLRGLGVDITYAEVEELAQRQGTQIIGRPHIGQVLVDKGIVPTMKDAFTRYIGEGKPAYARKDLLPPQHAIESIHHAGGLAVLAHPIQLKYETAEELDAIVLGLKNMGLDGIEVQHSDHTHEHVEQYTALAEKYGLLRSGGSDYHGTRKPVMLGGQKVPREFLEAMRERAQSII